MIVMRNKHITTIDLSETDDQSEEALNFVLTKIDSHAFVKHLILDNMK
jgi:hypothetical protein